jgi:TonB-dependent receptor-like protein
VNGEIIRSFHSLRMTIARWLLFTVCSLLFTPMLQAQIAAEQRDTTSDTTRTDTIYTTARYLKAEEQVSVRVPTLPRVGVEGPRPALTRIVFTRDSIEWGNAATVSDLLAEVPGVYLWRGGYLGRPELVNYRGRGNASAEYYLDGIPYPAMGVDSLAVDPALFSISFLDRIEVEPGPGQIKVYLFTLRHDRLAPRSRIAIARGDGDFARYEASLEYRYAKGLGFGIAGDYLISPTLSVRSSKYSNTQVWAQGSYIPSAHVGIQYQLVRSAPNRRPFVISELGVDDTLGPGYKARRTDAQIRLTLAGGKRVQEGLGSRADLFYTRSAWDGSGLKQQDNQIGGYLTFRAPVFSLGGSAFHRTRWTPLDTRAEIGWNPLPPFSASAELVHQHHFGGRTSNYGDFAAGLRLVRGLALTGSARVGKLVAAPSIVTDTAQEVRDFQGSLAWSRARLGFQVSYGRTSAFSPYPYADFPEVAGFATQPETDWLTASVRIAPLQWITLESWYSDPRSTLPEGAPPTHSFNAATIRSKFLRTFPSGIFDLKLSLSMETWGRGVIGRDALGAPIVLKGATFFRSLIQVQLDRFTIYWDRVNLSGTNLTYVPGFRIPDYASNFGVRWEFLN